MIRYEGARGVTWRIKYADADGRQVKETVGREEDGIGRKHAEAALRERLVKVETRGWRKPAPTLFRDYAAAWFGRAETKRGWKPGTVTATRTRLAHLNDAFGNDPVAAIRPRDIAAFIDDQLDTFAATDSQRPPQPPPRRAEGRGRGRADPLEPGGRGGAAEGEAQPLADPRARRGAAPSPRRSPTPGPGGCS